jgi:cation:H+ antiporter
LLLTILLLLSGATFLYIGGNWLVQGSSSFALRHGVSKLVVGLTIVAFGTSAPELFISTVAALKESTSIAIGNIVGSNIANIALILGFAAIINPPRVMTPTIRVQIPFAIIITGIFLALTLNGQIAAVDSVVLLSCFVLFTGYCIWSAREKGRIKVEVESILPNPLRDVVYIIIGLAGLTLGSEIFVRGAIGLAEYFGVSEFMIGLSVVALGTSLPELATSIVAAAKRESEIVVGNVIGSCIFNILLVMGIVGLIKPIYKPDMSILLDMGVMLGLTILLLPMFYTGRRLSRIEGFALLLVYVGYIAYIAVRG